MFTVYFSGEAVADFESTEAAAEWVSNEVRGFVVKGYGIPQIEVIEE